MQRITLILWITLLGQHAWSQKPWTLDRTGIFTRLTPFEVAVDKDGQVFLLDRESIQIRQFGPDGEEKRIFAGRGEGPGETLRALKLTLSQGRLYLIGAPHVLVFDREGNFLLRMETPEDAIKIDRVHGGFLIMTNPFTDPEGATYYQIADEQFLQREPILRVEGNPVIRRRPAFAPLADHHYTAVSRDGKRIYIRPAGTFHIHVFDVVQRREIDLLTRDDPPQRVSSEYMADYARWRAENLADRGLPPRPLGEFPEYFPAMAGMYTTPEDQLAVIRYSGEFNREETLFFDRNGNPTTPGIQPSQLRHVLALEEDWAYVATFDNEREEAGIAKVPRAELDAFLDRR